MTLLVVLLLCIFRSLSSVVAVSIPEKEQLVLSSCAYKHDPAAILGNHAMPTASYTQWEKNTTILPLQQQTVTLKIVNVGEGTTGTHWPYQVACEAGIPSCHYKVCCHVNKDAQNVQKHLIELYNRMKAHDFGPNGDIYDEILETITKMATNGVVFISDVPMGFILPELLQLIPDVHVLHTLREPEIWARKRYQEHQGKDIICSEETVRNGSVISYFSMLQCLKANPQGVLQQKETIQPEVDASFDKFAAKVRKHKLFE
jgi:hypothetical protein